MNGTIEAMNGAIEALAPLQAVLGSHILPPGLLLILGGLALPFIGRAFRGVVALLMPAIVLGLVLSTPDGVQLSANFIGYDLEIVKGDNLSRVFAVVFSIMAFTGGLFALVQARTMELASASIYAGAAIGVTMAGDLITMFVFWEIMAVASTLVLWAAGTPESYKAAMRYLGIHLLGGVVLMVGVVAHIVDTGSVAFTTMQVGSFGTWMILAGFLVNAGAPPLSAWIADAYPEASPSGMVFLSAFTTKTAVYVLIRGFPGTEFLIFVGLYMIAYGIIYALMENDMRRILGYTVVNQVGFMVVGVGIGTEMSLNGAAAHAFAHIIYEPLLIMAAGAVLYQTGKRRCTDLGGLFRTMPLTTACALIGALSISAFPLTSGFTTKSMISAAAANEHMAIVWFGLLAGSAGIFMHAGLKFPWFVFFNKDSGMRPQDPPWNMKAAMILFAVLCIFIGVNPGPLYALLPYPVTYEAYSLYHVMEMLQILAFSALAFFVLLPLMRRTLTISMDWDWFYRVLGPALAKQAVRFLGLFGTNVETFLTKRVKTFISAIKRAHGPDGFMAKTLHLNAMVFWVVALLAFYLLINFAPNMGAAG